MTKPADPINKIYHFVNIITDGPHSLGGDRRDIIAPAQVIPWVMAAAGNAPLAGDSVPVAVYLTEEDPVPTAQVVCPPPKESLKQLLASLRQDPEVLPTPTLGRYPLEVARHCLMQQLNLQQETLDTVLFPVFRSHLLRRAIHQETTQDNVMQHERDLALLFCVYRAVLVNGATRSTVLQTVKRDMHRINWRSLADPTTRKSIDAYSNAIQWVQAVPILSTCVLLGMLALSLSAWLAIPLVPLVVGLSICIGLTIQRMKKREDVYSNALEEVQNIANPPRDNENQGMGAGPALAA